MKCHRKVAAISFLLAAGFMLFALIDHGSWLEKAGIDHRVLKGTGVAHLDETLAAVSSVHARGAHPHAPSLRCEVDRVADARAPLGGVPAHSPGQTVAKRVLVSRL